MDTSWLDDFLSLAECLNFSRAAERRGVTQSAMSRRIRSLEEAMGAPLFSRDTHRLELTAAGEAFRTAAFELRRRLDAARRDVLEAAALESSQLRFASTHALSLTFFPAWLRTLERDRPVGAMRLTADTMAACEQAMLDGRCQFLLCHHHPAAPSTLGAREFRSIRLGMDALVPVSAPGPDGEPLHALPGRPEAPVPAVQYGEASGLGRILAAVRGADGPECWLEPAFTTHAAVVLAAMARGGRGMAFPPESLVADDLASGRLVRAGEPHWDIAVEIRLFRPAARQAPAAERFWTRLLAERTEGAPGRDADGVDAGGA